MPHTPPAVPAFTKWPSFPFEGEFRVKNLEDPVAVEPPRKGEGTAECISCNAPDEAYIWVSERWRVRAMDRPSGLPIVLILESRSHLDLGDLPNLLAAELGVMTVRLERAVRSLDGVGRVHVNRWGDGSAHLHMWFLARPYGRLQLRGTFLSLWDDILPPIPETQWRENLALVAAWLAEFGGRPLAEPPRIQWQAPSNLTQQEAQAAASVPQTPPDAEEGTPAPSDGGPGRASDAPARAGDPSAAAEAVGGTAENATASAVDVTVGGAAVVPDARVAREDAAPQDAAPQDAERRGGAPQSAAERQDDGPGADDVPGVGRAGDGSGTAGRIDQAAPTDRPAPLAVGSGDQPVPAGVPPRANATTSVPSPRTATAPGETEGAPGGVPPTAAGAATARRQEAGGGSPIHR